MKSNQQFFNQKTIVFTKIFTVNGSLTRVKDQLSSSQHVMRMIVAKDLNIVTLEEEDAALLDDSYQWQLIGKDFKQFGTLTFLEKSDQTTQVDLRLSLHFASKNDHSITRGLLAVGGKHWFEECARQLKQLIETSEVASTTGQSHGVRGLLNSRMMTTREYFEHKIDHLMNTIDQKHPIMESRVSL